MEIKEIQDELKKGKGMSNYNKEELKYVRTPIGKGLYLNALDTKKDKDEIIDKPKDEKPKWNDRIKCSVCGSIINRANKSRHKKSNHHQIYAKMDSKIKKMLLD